MDLVTYKEGKFYGQYIQVSKSLYKVVVIILNE